MHTFYVLIDLFLAELLYHNGYTGWSRRLASKSFVLPGHRVESKQIVRSLSQVSLFFFIYIYIFFLNFILFLNFTQVSLI